MFLRVSARPYASRRQSITQSILRSARDLACGNDQAVPMEIAELILWIASQACTFGGMQEVQYGIQCDQRAVERAEACGAECLRVIRAPGLVIAGADGIEAGKERWARRRQQSLRQRAFDLTREVLGTCAAMSPIRANRRG